MTAQVNEPRRPVRPSLDETPRDSPQVIAVAKDTVQEGDGPLGTCAVDAIEGQLHTHVRITSYGARPAGASAVSLTLAVHPVTDDPGSRAVCSCDPGRLHAGEPPPALAPALSHAGLRTTGSG